MNDYTERWSRGGEIGHVELSGGGRVVRQDPSQVQTRAEQRRRR
jgi:hypothetical protein